MPVVPTRPPGRNLVPLAARLSYGALRRRTWLPSFTAPAENPPASATGAAEPGLGGMGSPRGRTVGAALWGIRFAAPHQGEWEGKSLTWELTAPNWALQTELQLEEMVCWSRSAPRLQDPPGQGAEVSSCLPAIPGTHMGPCKPPEVQ